MGYKIKFDTLTQMLSFITYTFSSTQYRLGSWKCKKFTLTNAKGSMLDINTRQFGNSDYVLFNSVHFYINQYIEANADSTIRLDIKLVCPEALRFSFDVKRLFDDFYVSFYSYNNENSYVNCGFREAGGLVLTDTSQQVDLETMTDEQAIAYSGFVTYVQQMYDSWYTNFDNYSN